ncbi:unnamed protein product [Orchesella dallaii]|uniref:Ion transport domain-containing protein n=1 Tax=Orchesella dallaii TaxID=48710 RepID=A0ABP1QPN9_9HEXA
MGNCIGRNETINPGQVLDRVISQANNDDDCLLYKLANYKKGGELIEAYNIGGMYEVEKLIREQFGILMYKDGKGQTISRTEYLRWKFRNTKHVVIPVLASGPTDPLGKWEDHEACWQMQYRGSLGETLLHLLIICDTKLHTRLAKVLLKCFPKLAVDCVEGEEYLGASALHLAIAYTNNDLVDLLVKSGAKIDQRAIGSFFLPRDQQRMKPAKNSDYEGLAYLGEYPLSWAACTNNEGVYNLLIDSDSDPDLQDSFGNAVLHMVVIHDQLGMFGYALRHPRTKASNDTENDQGLTPLTLACRLGRADVFKEMLELSCKEFWRYSNITCSAYPLNALDTILPDGKTNWNSALFMILAGGKEEHLDMLDGGIIQRLLEEKWKTFAQRQFMKRMMIAFLHLLAMSIAVYFRPKDRTRNLLVYKDIKDVIRWVFEALTVLGCLSFVFVQQGEEIKNQGLASFLKGLPNAPPKALFIVANFLILFCIPYRWSGNILMEEALLTFAMVFSWFFMMFFAGAIQLTGPFVTMIYSMITGDMLTFGIIYGIFLLGFSQSFYYLYKSHPDRNGTMFYEYDVTWMAMYQMTLGSYSYSDLSQLVYPNAAKAVFITFMIMVPILLLNMLIAMMGNTYSQVIERSEKEWVKQWAKIVVTLERAVSQEDAMKYIQEYSIKLSGTDLSNEVRGVMVIKIKSKTKAKQRKGAVVNWKRVMKVTITALKRKKMTGEQMRQLMWGHRTSVCTPRQTPRQRSLAVDQTLDGTGVAGVAGVGVMGLDGALDTIAFAQDLDLKVNQGVTPVGGKPGEVSINVTTVATAGSTTTTTAASRNYLAPNAKVVVPKVHGIPQIASLPQRSPAAQAKSKQMQMDRQDYQAPPPDYNSIVEKAGLPVALGGLSTSTASLKSPSTDLKLKRRNKLGLRPRIIIFSDKKDLIRVSLDSDDESDSEICNLSFKKPTTKFHGMKSARRRSIAGESFTLSSSMESLSEKPKGDQSTSKENLVLIGYDDIPDIEGAINYAFDPEEFAAVEEAEAKLAEQAIATTAEPEPESDTKGNGKAKPKLLKKDSSKSESQTDDEPSASSSMEKARSRPKSARPKSGKTRDTPTKPSPKRVKVATKDSIPEQVDEEEMVEEDKQTKEATASSMSPSKDSNRGTAFENKKPSSSSKDKSKAGRSKSAKNGQNKVDPKSKSGTSSSSKSKGKTKSKKNKDDKDDAEDDGDDSSSSPARTRPVTALDRWNNKDVENMSKLVAWDRPEDDI